ncbi:TetR family transcriptional regulator [Actinorhabdospora filicis]|uniref:TetR family transcriptional regulator n=1 Tax=Actinorhabdospora filicis TaxID=1785913 RepID=A0A9W6W8Y8_9ACTN|nr:TetR/AcrR family transcriptional regulator [Actinorhabdospora filicis]GLZ77468.1 TetR family transcriptional regulator [Actinorhabdospora filicis]
MSDTVPSVWTTPGKRPKPALTREQILAKTIEILDAEGIEALSMRRLGAELNAGATSMYRHVANKEQLLELAVDEVYGEVVVPRLTDPAQWRDGMRAMAHSIRAALLKHRWMVSLLGESGVAHLGPNLMRIGNDVLGLFEDSGFKLLEADRLLKVVNCYVIGNAIAEAAWLNSIARSGMTPEEWIASMWPAAREAARAYPNLNRLYSAQEEQTVAPDSLDYGSIVAEFDWGLERVLDGLALRL